MFRDRSSLPYACGPTFIQVQALMSVCELQFFVTVLSLAHAVDPESYEIIFSLSQMAFINKTKEPKANSSTKKCVEANGDPNFLGRLCLHCAVGLRKPLGGR